MGDRRVRLCVRGCVKPVTMVLAIMVVNAWQVPTGYAQHMAVAPAERARDAQRVTVNVENVPLATVLHTIARQAGLVPVFEEALIPANPRVTLHLRDVAANDAFQQALRGTGLVAHIREEGNVVIVRDGRLVVTGTIVGQVTDAKTKQPLRGVAVELANTGAGVTGSGRSQTTTTGEDGTYRLAGVSAGVHTVTIKLLGYSKATRTITVQDDATVQVDVTLETSANVLDQVVVTGTVIPTELKAVPNAMTVITAKDIEQRGITKIDQLFHGDVPGLFAPNQGSSSRALLDQVVLFSRGATALSSKSMGVTNFGFATNTNPIKTYVDGVELADPQYLSQIDPKSIERIEILTGPQASTIYGSNAINGVMQVFTKRGTASQPQFTLQFMNGWVQNNFSSAVTPKHDYDVQLNGVEGRLSYNVGGSWNYTGPWTPTKQTTRIGGFGGVRLDLPTAAGRVTADLTLRHSSTQNQQHGADYQTMTEYGQTGWYSPVGSASDFHSGIATPTTSILGGQTLGLTLEYAPVSWWSHELTLGQDVLDDEDHSMGKGYATPDDTLLNVDHTFSDRRSLRYATIARIPLTTVAQATVTAGADASQASGYSWYASDGKTLFPTYFNSTGLSRSRDHNTGAFFQTQLGVRERLFLTYGVRAEWNPGIGDKAKVLPGRYGVAYSQDVGSVTAKLRASYGRSIRPPNPTYQLGVNVLGPGSDFDASIIPLYGNFDRQLPNPELVPEYQQGGEGGLELYVGTRGSLVVTRYNQTVNGLIDLVPKADSVRSLAPNPVYYLTCTQWITVYALYVHAPSPYCSSQDADGYGYIAQSEYLNIGSIRNQGWELQGSVNTGPLTTKGTYSWTKSRVIGITPKYRSLFTIQDYPQYQVGAPFKYLTEHSWAASVTYAKAATTMGLNITGIGRTPIDQNALVFQSFSSAIRLPQNRLNMNYGQGYISFNAGYALASLTASQRVSSRIEGVLNVQNLMNRYTNDYNASYASLGRQTTLGLRLRL